jgi:hypothetical protein
MLLYSQGSADIRAVFHLYIGLDGDDAEMQQLAHQYALDSLGTLKLVHHKGTNTNSGASSASSAGQDSSSSEQQGKPSGRKLQGASTHSSTVHAEHVRMMLHVFLQCFQYPSVLLLEDDWKLLPDFFEYFYATSWLLVRKGPAGQPGSCCVPNMALVPFSESSDACGELRWFVPATST